jgi:hypothetical protein
VKQLSRAAKTLEPVSNDKAKLSDNSKAFELVCEYQKGRVDSESGEGERRTTRNYVRPNGKRTNYE